MAYCAKGRCCKWSCGVVGLIFLITGCVLIKVFDNLIHSKVEDNLPLKNGTDSYKNWLSPPAPIYFRVWMQHVSNAQEVVQTGAKPVLVQQGPYTYRERRKKVNITYEDGGKILSYQEKKWYYFERDLSVGPETDNFTTANLFMLTVANMARFQYGWLQDILNFVLDKTDEHLFINLTVYDLMWGYEDNLLKDIKQAAAKFGIKLPFDDKFGLFYKSDDNVLFIPAGKIKNHIMQNQL